MPLAVFCVVFPARAKGASFFTPVCVVFSFSDELYWEGKLFSHSKEDLHNRRMWEPKKQGTLRGKGGQSVTIRRNEKITFSQGALVLSVVYDGTITGSYCTLGADCQLCLG